MLIDGLTVASQILSELEQEVSTYPEPPGLAVIIIGDNPASRVYVNMKTSKANKLGFSSTVHRLPSNTSLPEILKLIGSLNSDPSIHGILVQLPLPNHLNEQTIIQNIAPEKDVDGLHPVNMGKLLLGRSDGFTPCTPAGIVTLLTHYQIPIQGKHVVVLGRSNIVGKPLAALLMQKHPQANATVTLAHSQSLQIQELLQSADILITAIGIPNFIKRDMVSSKTVIIDVGINRVPNEQTSSGYTLVGDADFKNLVDHCKAITPVPGGVGPMTVAMLMKNTCESFKRSLS